MKARPILEEVREYFKNAKEIECLGDGKIYSLDLFPFLEIGKDKFETGSYLYSKMKIFTTIPNDNYIISWNSSKGYAKIISYKEEAYQITKKQILDLHRIQCVSDKNDVLESLFPSVFKEEEKLFNEPILSLDDLLSVWCSDNDIEIYKESPLFKSFENLAKSKKN